MGKTDSANLTDWLTELFMQMHVGIATLILPGTEVFYSLTDAYRLLSIGEGLPE